MRQPEHVFVDLHVLQTLPPSCVNRDETGDPKTAVYGGVTRARVSSQSWKRAMRLMFNDLFDAEDIGKRTKMSARMIAAKIAEMDPNLDADKLAEKALELAGIKSKDGKTDAMLFISDAQAAALAELQVKGEKDKKLYKKALKDCPSVDMALFGRMVASDPSLNYDAAAQVAHAISTHAVENEDDYFTAVDDMADEDNAGAGHLGTMAFNSAVLYRYASVSLNELAKLLGDETPDAVKKFAEAFIYSMPGGKQTSFANTTAPDAIYITIRTNRPANLVGAFEEPVEADTHGYMKESEKALAGYAERLYDRVVGAPYKAFVCGMDDYLDSLGENVPVPEMLDRLEQSVAGLLTEEDS